MNQQVKSSGGPGSTSIPSATLCGCFRCQDQRRKESLESGDEKRFWTTLHGMDPHFRFACEICGNKRCPHHTDHRLNCTGSNEPGQPGSDYQ